MSKCIGVVFPHIIDEKILRELEEEFHIRLVLEKRVTFRYRLGGEVLYSMDQDEAVRNSGIGEYFYWHENAPNLFMRMKKCGASKEEIEKAMCTMRSQADVYEYSAEIWTYAIRKLVSFVPYVGIIVYMSEDGVEVPVLSRKFCPKGGLSRDFIMQIQWRTLMLFSPDCL